MLSPASNSCSLSEHTACKMKQILAPLRHTGTCQQQPHVSDCFLFLRHLWHHMWHHTGDPRGIPVAGQMWHDFQRLQLRLVNRIKIRPENMTDWKHTHTITGKERCSLLTRPPATAGIHSSPLLSLWSSPESWTGVTLPSPHSLTNPLFHCWKELMSCFLLNAQPTSSGHPAGPGVLTSAKTQTHVQVHFTIYCFHLNQSPPPKYNTWYTRWNTESYPLIHWWCTFRIGLVIDGQRG